MPPSAIAIAAALEYEQPHGRSSLAQFSSALASNSASTHAHQLWLLYSLLSVAVPAICPAGLPLSIFFLNRLTALLFILVVNPLACLAAACYLVLCNRQSTSTSNSSSRHSTSLHQQPSQQCSSVAGAYGDLLLRPKHWFAIWRHNCLVVGYHALVSGSSSYRLEDKGVFLLEVCAIHASWWITCRLSFACPGLQTPVVVCDISAGRTPALHRLLFYVGLFTASWPCPACCHGSRGIA